jgi:hypothetical protein
MVCVTCGTELLPERAKKYNYCTAPECQEKNFKGLTMVGIGMNKSGEELLILDEQTQADMASGKYRDQRRALFGQAAAPAPAPVTPARKRAPARPRPQPPAAPPRWTPRQERLALLYNEQGLRPDEIAAKLGVSRHLATQIVLAARSRRKG